MHSRGSFAGSWYGFGVVLLVAGWLAFGASLQAQQITGSIRGTVKDGSGAVIPGVAVTASNSDTGQTRSGVTGADGTYTFFALPLGNYEIRAEHPGFQREVQSGLKLNVGQAAVINFALQVGAVEQTVAVTAEAPMIETTTADVSGLVDEAEVRDLPLNARNLVELATLFPGITVSKEGGSGGGVPNGFATKLAIVGTRYNSSLFQLDGADINDATGSAGGAAGILMGVETVREFNVITSGYSAEYGKHSGGVFNAVTKSGSNALHGSVFEFLRNDSMDARNFFDREIAPFKRNQFGFAVGGPVARDRTFFFGSFEGLRERLGVTQIFDMPNADARRGILPGGVFEVNPAVQPFLDSYALPNGDDSGDGTGEFVRAQSLPTDENFFTVKIDHTISDSSSIFGRYTFDDAERATNNSFNSNTLNSTRSQYAALSETHLFSPQVINVFLLGFNRSLLGQDPVVLPGFTLPQESFTGRDAGGLGNIDVEGIDLWGGRSTTPTKSLLNMYQFKNDLYYTPGNHAFKFGFNIQRNQYLRKTFFNGGGQFEFDSLEDFYQGRVNTFTAMPIGNDDAAVYPRQNLIGLYAQDDIRLFPGFTLNLGLRYEAISVPHVLNDRISNLHNYLTPGQTADDIVIGNPFFENPSLTNFAPRIGFAWDPTGSGKTSVRGGIGVFYDQLLAGPFLFSYVSAPPFFANANFRRSPDGTVIPQFPDAFSVQQDRLSSGSTQTEPIQFNIDQPTIYKYSMDIQQAITPSTSVEAGFAATRGVHLMRVLLVNVPPQETVDGRGLFISSTGSRRIHPSLGRTRPKVSDTTSDYFGFRLQVNQRYTRGLMMRGAYTWSKTIDDGSNFAGGLDFGQTGGQSRYSTVKDTGLSSFDIEHALTMNFVYDLPGSNLQGAARKFLGGWQTSGILTVQSGTPFDVSTGVAPGFMRGVFLGDYPDAVAGREVQYDTRNPDQYFDPSTFALPPGFSDSGAALGGAFVGNAARNLAIGPGIAQFNFVLAKRTQLSERVTLQFRSEFHNLFNRANFGRPGGRVFASATSGAPFSRVGRIIDTSTTSRQVQLALKLEF